MCDEIINVIVILSTDVTNTVPANVTSTVSIICSDKKLTCEKNDCLIYTISLALICLLLLVVISISCYYIIKGIDYCCITHDTRKPDAISLLVYNYYFNYLIQKK